MIIVEGTEEANLSFVGSVHAGTYFQIVVAVCNTCIKTIVETLQHRVGSIPLVVVESRNTWVTPCADRFIGCEFITVPKLTDKSCGTTVETVDVAVAISTCLTLQCHVRVAFGKERCLIGNHGLTGINRCDVEVARARTQSYGSKENCCCGNYVFEIS